MKINFIGLSCFLIENEKGFRVLVDPFNPAPEWALEPKFPMEFNGKPFGANIVLMTEPDADHAYTPGDWLYNAPATKPNGDPFPDLNLRGTVIYEWNGDLNIAYHYTIDGIRLAHFGDNSHILTKSQLKEFGKLDIIFVSPPKADGEKLPESVDIIRKNIALLKPKVVVWAHHLAPIGLPELNNKAVLRNFFQVYFKENAATNKMYKDENTFMSLCYCLENAIEISRDYQLEIIKDNSINIDTKYLNRGERRPVAILFTSMLAK